MFNLTVKVPQSSVYQPITEGPELHGRDRHRIRRNIYPPRRPPGFFNLLFIILIILKLAIVLVIFH